MQVQGDYAHPDLRDALSHLIKAGGKRIRPVVGLLVGNVLGAPKPILLKLGAAVELLHTATLVHDDLIDNSLLRRGMPTINATWSSAATVLTGDYLFARAARLSAETEHLELMRLFADTLGVIVNGELTQLFSSRGIVSRENYYQRIYAKTASLFEMTTKAAAMISPVGDDVVETMRLYGYNLGMAFQIVDDILDFTSDSMKLGKPVGSDLLQGLITLPALYYIENNPNDSTVLEFLETGLSSSNVLRKLILNIQQSNVIELAMLEAKQHVTTSLDLLDPLSESSEKTALRELATYVVDRNM